MCEFRVMNPHQWSFTKQSSFQNWKSDDQKVQKKAEAKEVGDINPQNFNLNYISIMENVDTLKTLRINRSRP